TGESAEGGLLGIAIDPKDATRLYLYATVPGPKNELQRWTLAADHRSARREKIVLAGIAASRFHDGGRIRFGPDGFLYVGTGDALGWPAIYGCRTASGMAPPLLTWSSHAVPPGGVVVYRGTAIPEFRENVLVATLGSEHLHRVVLDDSGSAVKLHEVYFRQKL